MEIETHIRPNIEWAKMLMRMTGYYGKHSYDLQFALVKERSEEEWENVLTALVSSIEDTVETGFHRNTPWSNGWLAEKCKESAMWLAPLMVKMFQDGLGKALIGSWIKALNGMEKAQ